MNGAPLTASEKEVLRIMRESRAAEAAAMARMLAELRERDARLARRVGRERAGHLPLSAIACPVLPDDPRKVLADLVFDLDAMGFSSADADISGCDLVNLIAGYLPDMRKALGVNS